MYTKIQRTITPITYLLVGAVAVNGIMQAFYYPNLAHQNPTLETAMRYGSVPFLIAAFLGILPLRGIGLFRRGTVPALMVIFVGCALAVAGLDAMIGDFLVGFSSLLYTAVLVTLTVVNVQQSRVTLKQQRRNYEKRRRERRKVTV